MGALPPPRETVAACVIDRESYDDLKPALAVACLAHRPKRLALAGPQQQTARRRTFVRRSWLRLQAAEASPTLPPPALPPAAARAPMAALSAAERLQLLARSWTTVAEGYRSNFVHRFAPWTQDTLAAFVRAGAGLPRGGAIAVPACGPGEQLRPDLFPHTCLHLLG